MTDEEIETRVKAEMAAKMAGGDGLKGLTLDELRESLGRVIGAHYNTTIPWPEYYRRAAQAAAAETALALVMERTGLTREDIEGLMAGELRVIRFRRVERAPFQFDEGDRV